MSVINSAATCRYRVAAGSGTGSAPKTGPDQGGRGVAPDRWGGGDFLPNLAILAAGHTPPGFDATTLLVIVAAVVLLALVAGGGRGRGRSRSRRGGSGTTVYVVIGALIGATVLGTTVLRPAVAALLSALTALGGLFH